MIKFIAVSAVLALAGAAPAADAEADPQYLAAAPLAAPLAYHAPATNCATVVEILTTQTCTPRAENVCTKQIVETEEIEYEKVCKEVTDVICDAPAAPYVAAAPAVAVAAPAVATAVVKREADAEADPQYLLGGYHAAAPVVAPAVHAVAHSVKATVRHACREVVTEHCVDNPIVKPVPVEVEHCHTVTKVDCAPVDNEIPTTKCDAVVSEHVSHAAYASPYVYGK
jgi:hypothetical protein